jgi:hypothetical protein
VDTYKDYGANNKNMKKQFKKNTIMELYEIEVITEPIYFRKMRVESGYLYNFYDCKEERYQKEWIFVPDVTQQIIIGETGKFPEVKVEPLKNSN